MTPEQRKLARLRSFLEDLADTKWDPMAAGDARDLLAWVDAADHAELDRLEKVELNFEAGF